MGDSWLSGFHKSKQFLSKLIKFPQGTKRCGPVGRDCIEKKSSQTFNCSVTCDGVYADVHWITDIIKEEVEDEPVEVEVSGEVGEELKKMQKQLVNMKLVYKSLRKEMEESFGRRGEELDREKYVKLLSEYKSFKKNNVLHFRFNSEANSTMFGKSVNLHLFKLIF